MIRFIDKFINRNGDTILILNAGSRAEKIARADITFSESSARETEKIVSGKVIRVKTWKLILILLPVLNSMMKLSGIIQERS